MKFYKILICLVLISFSTVAVHAQELKEKRGTKKANKLFDAGEYLIAIDKYKKAVKKVKRKPEKAKIHFNIAECYRMLDMNKKAEGSYKRAIKLKHKNPIAHLYYADALKMNLKFPEAREAYKEYVTIVPEDERGQFGIASLDSLKKWQGNPTKHLVEEMKEFNTKKADFSPAYAKGDYSLLYYTSAREECSGEEVSNASGQYFTDIFQVRRDRKGKWSTPTPISDTLSSVIDEGAVTLNKKFTTLYFTRCMAEKGANYGCKIYRSSRKGDKWSPATLVEIAAISDSTISMGHPTLSDDELTLIFSAQIDTLLGQKTRTGGKDIWMTTRRKKTYPWKQPVNLGSDINTDGDELFPYIFNDSTLFFASDGHLGMGGLDIFKAKKQKNGSWKVENMKYPINSVGHDFGIIMEENGEAGYFTSTREGGTGGDDIWAFSLPDITFRITGIVKNELTDQVIGNVNVNMLGSNGISLNVVTETDGKFKFNLKKNTDYIFKATKKWYMKTGSKETTKGHKESKNFNMVMYLTPLVDETTGEVLSIELPNIEYDFDSAKLRKVSEVSLDELIVKLNENPEIRIELGSHTDYKGDNTYNDTLSQARAQSVVDYLVGNEIVRNRLVAKGYGETKPKVIDSLAHTLYPFLAEKDTLNEAYIIKLTKDQQERANQINRRTEFKLIKDEEESSKNKDKNKDPKPNKDKDRNKQRKENDND